MFLRAKKIIKKYPNTEKQKPKIKHFLKTSLCELKNSETSEN